MNAIHRCAALMLVLAAGSAAGAPCAGFTDVADTSGFCPNVEWLKNRAITLGCTSPTLYCPADPVSRLAMAAFMNRLGTALTPVSITAEATPGAVDVDASPVVCATNALAVANFPRRAFIDASVSGTATGALDIGASIVSSTDGGTTWTPLDSNANNAVVANQWSNVSNIALSDIEVGQSVRFGVRISRIDAGAVDLGDSRCSVRAVVYSRNGASSPF